MSSCFHRKKCCINNCDTAFFCVDHFSFFLREDVLYNHCFSLMVTERHTSWEQETFGTMAMSETIIGIYATGNGVDSENRQNLTGLR